MSAVGMQRRGAKVASISVHLTSTERSEAQRVVDEYEAKVAAFEQAQQPSATDEIMQQYFESKASVTYACSVGMYGETNPENFFCAPPRSKII